MIKINNVSRIFQLTKYAIILGILILHSGGINIAAQNKGILNELESDPFKEIVWHVKAIHPEGNFLDIKAMDKDGNIYDVKAIQDANQRTIIDIKAMVDGKRLPIKILVSKDKFRPVKAIKEDGTILDIKALTPEGDLLDVKGVSNSGKIINIKAIDKKGGFYGVKAISPTGKLNDVKGIKLTQHKVEMNINGVDVYAHIKSIASMGCTNDNFVWHIRAIHPEGHLLSVMAFDNDGKSYDIKAIRESNQRSLMDIKAFVGNKQIPIKILLSDDKYAPVKAISEDGSIYDVKAIDSEGNKLDIKGVSRSGNIIHIKAINKNGLFYGIKAISPEGQLNDVKGVKMIQEPLEVNINGVDVYAHVKALSQQK